MAGKNGCDQRREKLAHLAIALSLLDADVKREEEGQKRERSSNDGDGTGTDKAQNACKYFLENKLKRWSETTIRRPEFCKCKMTIDVVRLNPLIRELPFLIDNLQAFLRGERQSNLLQLLGLTLNGHGPANLEDFLKNALKQAIEVTEKREENNQVSSVDAGAMYLYDTEHDELVMAASQGFPLKTANSNGLKALADNALSIANEWDHALPKSDPKKWNIDEEPTLQTQFFGNVYRLKHIKDVLRPSLAGSAIPREPLVSEAVRGWYAPPPEECEEGDWTDLDCNELLVGIAYYRPGHGITGQLFDKKKGPELEREQLSPESKLGSDCDKIFDTVLGSAPVLAKHFKDNILRKQTLVFEQRADMAAGRSVKAGVYEGLQFPSSSFIGPFLGTVLHFNGEHLGILKVERHKFNSNKPKTVNYTEDPTKLAYQAKQIVDFLLFSYALSGILYILKHHAGMDLREGWMISD